MSIVIPTNVLVLRVTNNTNKIIENISFNYDESNMKDTVISSLKPNQNKQVGISTINIRNNTKIMMYNEVNGQAFSYIIKEEMFNSEISTRYAIPTNIYINDVKDNGELVLSVTIEE